ncbi:hypothetical protein [Intrasporangium sp. DVR]|uniref:hypothetical protein n=1 Tax=Intrasporangium sp. DVR TaxID=3127867 RepID=UPI00313A7083
MSVDQQLRQAAHRVADSVVPPEVDVATVRARVRRIRHRTVSVALTAAVAAAIVVGAALGAGRDTSAPVLPAQQPRQSATARTPLQIWVEGLPDGPGPLLAFARDGVLHVRGVEVSTPRPVVAIRARRDVVAVKLEAAAASPARWALVRGDRLEALPTPADADLELSPDGRFASWEATSMRGRDSTRFVVWDTTTNEQVAARDVPGRYGVTPGDGPYLLGVGSDGIAYWLREVADPQVTRWDVRADTVRPTDVTYDSALPLYPQLAALGEVWLGLDENVLSPDGTRRAFTATTPQDPPGCCARRLRVGPLRPVESMELSDITTLQLPEGIPHKPLFSSSIDYGTPFVWWETDDSLLLEAVVEGRSHLVRCATTDGACERVVDLGRSPWRFGGEAPDRPNSWRDDWIFPGSEL